jgi:hypothetical protein
MTTTVFDVPGSVGEAMYDAASATETQNNQKRSGPFSAGFYLGAEWFAAGMAVCAFLDDLAHIYDEQRCHHGRPRPSPGIRLHEACIDCWNEMPF